jgi:endonuclease YncB( thermonuclease family)
MSFFRRPLERFFKTLGIPKAYGALAALILGAAFSFLVGCFSRNSADVRVVRIVDGDTVDVDSGVTVRYIGIDTPETRRQTSAGWVATGDEDGEEAKKANEALVMGKKVRLEYDVQKKDRYGRTLAYVFVRENKKEIMVQTELLRRGLAFLYTLPPNVRYADVFLAAQKEARKSKAGMWAHEFHVPAAQACNFIGQRKFIMGKVVHARRTDKMVSLEMDGLHIVIFTKDLGFFESAGIRPAQDYTGKKVSVFGLIKSYRGSPEIIVSHPWQIEILDRP